MSKLRKCLIERININKRRYNWISEPNDDIDRISCLPDELKVHILSFLGIKEAVQTCVLSKTWKNTWAFLPLLFFDSRDFLPDNLAAKLSGENIREREIKFGQFVKDTLQKREASDLKYFVLIFNDGVKTVNRNCASCNFEDFRGCILRALEFRPQFLCVFLCKHKLLSSYEIFTHDSLQEIFLGCKGEPIQIAPKSVHLPCLKILHLQHVTVNDDFLAKIFSGCPIIEEIALCTVFLTASRISSHTLKNLFMRKGTILNDLEVCAPALSRLRFNPVDDMMGTISLKKMLALSNAAIDFSTCTRSDGFTVSGPDLIKSLSNVTNLHLTVPASNVKALLEKGVAHWPSFKNLESLNIGGWCLNSDFRMVAFFLRSPNLQSLTLRPRNPQEVSTSELSGWEEPDGVTFQRELLEIVKITKRRMSDEWIDKLLKKLHARVKMIKKIILD